MLLDIPGFYHNQDILFRFLVILILGLFSDSGSCGVCHPQMAIFIIFSDECLALLFGNRWEFSCLNFYMLNSIFWLTLALPNPVLTNVCSVSFVETYSLPERDEPKSDQYEQNVFSLTAMIVPKVSILCYSMQVETALSISQNVSICCTKNL